MFEFVLESTLNELGISRNYLAVEGKIRPATLHEMVHGKAVRLDLETLRKILVTLNRIAKEKGLERQYDIAAIIRFLPEDTN